LPKLQNADIKNVFETFIAEDIFNRKIAYEYRTVWLFGELHE